MQNTRHEKGEKWHTAVESFDMWLRLPTENLAWREIKLARFEMALAQRSLVSRTAARPCVIGRPVARRVLPVVRASLSEVTDASFADDVLNSSTPVLVDFWAPCKSTPLRN